MSEAKVIVALDFPCAEQALTLAEQLSPETCRLKIGSFLFTRYGPALTQRLIAMGFDLFLDLKFHDIPHTVAGAVAMAADLDVWMLTLHACGGRKMMEAAANVLAQRGKRPYLIAVTVLTSMDEAQLRAIGMNDSLLTQVERMTALARDAGLDGVVCAAQEARVTKTLAGESFLAVTPGIRPPGAAVADQARVMTPRQAVENGSDYLVIGRPITRASDPLAVIAAIDASLREH